MKWLTKLISNNLWHQILKCLMKNNKWLDFIKEQTILEKEKRMFKFISKHAEKRLQERMLYRWYSMDDIHRDIIQSKRWYKRKEATKIVGKLWTYIISNAGNLITVI